jgi:hypothetical protein
VCLGFYGDPVTPRALVVAAALTTEAFLPKP